MKTFLKELSGPEFIGAMVTAGIGVAVWLHWLLA